MKEERNYNRRYPHEYNIFRTIFYMGFVNLVVRSFFMIFFDYKITGRENLSKHRKSDKFLYTANHVSHLDPPLVTLAVMRPIAYMAKKELFEKSEKRSWLIKRLGAFAVDRTKPEIATFKTVRDILGTSWSLGVFPQGGIRPYGEIEGLKKGFIVIAKNAKADIIPVAIDKFSGYPKLRPFTRQKAEVHIGTPISYELPDDEIMYQWCRQISEMADYKNPLPEPAAVSH
ncbi:MAG: 1-acyl-sn-glycerol-3-phosphate acyltransferase [Heliobacteriaceae bacterium]|jgi:1-acyl-sn-glycerol-3-phosphate acyltransferase|nr:1-acyl-sn-glycerol-3-phosphate acyltransferase [Heliobacteriaceae bacterium]